jgi:hypothetical protein
MLEYILSAILLTAGAVAEESQSQPHGEYDYVRQDHINKPLTVSVY